MRLVRFGKLGLLLFLATAWAQTASEYSREASQLARNRESVKAIDILARALREYPDNLNLLLQSASLHLELGRTAQADHLLERAAAVDPGNGNVQRLLGETRLMQDRLLDAKKHFERSLNLASAPAQAHRRLAYIYLLDDDRLRSLEHARQAVQLDPARADYRRFLAFVLDQNGRSEEAFRQLKAAYRLAPRDAQLLFQLSQRVKGRRGSSQALEYVEMASEIDGENPLYHKELSELYDNLGQKQDAIRHANQASRLLRAFEDYVRALEISRQGRRREAIEFLETVISENPEFVTGRLYLADLYRMDGENVRASELYSAVLDRDPFEGHAREQGAWLRVQEGSVDEAIDLLRESPEGSPNQGFLEGHRLLLSEDWQAALDQFRSLEEKNPLNPQLLQLISYSLAQLGRRSEALLYLDKAGGLSRDERSIEQQQQDIRYSEAIEAIEDRAWRRALDLLENIPVPDSPADYLMNKAFCHQNLGELDQAIKLYREGLRQQPEAFWARLNLATSLYLRQRYSEAASEYETVIRNEENSEALFQLGICYSHLKRLAEAETAFRRARTQGLETPALFYNLGITQFRLGLQQAGLGLIRKSAEQGYRPAVDFMRHIKRE